MYAHFDFECEKCGQQFEEFVDRNTPSQVKCPVCGELKAKRLISAPRLDGALGVDSEAFPTLGDKWVRRRQQHQRIEERRKREHGD